MIDLSLNQQKAIHELHNGSILASHVGTGKSRTALGYYYESEGGICTYGVEKEMPFKPADLYIITTAKKRDSDDWEKELRMFGMSLDPEKSEYLNTVRVDSWNNVPKYRKVRNAFFIFDEQRASGYGPWAQAFIEIASNNHWIMLSATPGDNWHDYIPIFMVHGFVKNKTRFEAEFGIFERHPKYSKCVGYRGENKLQHWRNLLLVDMDIERTFIKHWSTEICEYDRAAYKDICRRRWNPWKDEPIQTAPEYCQCLRKIVNSDASRLKKCREIVKKHKKVIIFYNYVYELTLLKDMKWGSDTKVAEWNGQKHEDIPDSDSWVYLVQYTAGAEGWNCITTNAMIFYSLNYSWRVMDQSSGRIERRNSPYQELYYYKLTSLSGIDKGITAKLNDKGKFNEAAFAGLKAFKKEKYNDRRLKG